MKNMTYFPFERNKYFYGKLLTVDDFETEQRYFNDKRRVINRFLYGSGVVCGMNVIAIDDTTISVETGLALDFSGREIVIDTPVVKKLSMIDGFESFLKRESDKQYLYLCLDYEETEKDQVHNVTGADQVEYNRYREGGRLTVTDREPEEGSLSDAELYENAGVLYAGSGIRIRVVMPVCVQEGREFEIRLILENMGQMQPVEFACDLELTCLEHQGNNFIRVSFDEESFAKRRRYELTYQVRALTIQNARGVLELNPGSFELYIGGHRVQEKAGLKMASRIIEGSIQEDLRKNYYRSAMEDIVKNNYQQSIYLAKIFVIFAGESYVITDIETMPFGQFVYNNMLSAAMNRLTQKELERGWIAAPDRRQAQSAQEREYGLSDSQVMSAGYAVIDLGIGGNVGQRFFSEEISHDLGLGNVLILLGQCYGLTDDSAVVYGSPEVFEDAAPFKAELAAKADPARGTFRIGLRLTEPTMERYVRVNWTAFRDIREKRHDREEMALFIKPEMLYLKTRESYYLEAKFRGVEETPVRWVVREENGGTIEPNGKYTAPNAPGIYEVSASSTIYENLRASIFIVVRDIDR